MFYNVDMSKQDLVLEYIKQFMHQNGFAPTLREIKSGLDISSTSMVDFYLSKLRKAGKITYYDGMARTIRVLGTEKSNSNGK